MIELINELHYNCLLTSTSLSFYRTPNLKREGTSELLFLINDYLTKIDDNLCLIKFFKNESGTFLSDKKPSFNFTSIENLKELLHREINEVNLSAIHEAASTYAKDLIKNCNMTANWSDEMRNCANDGVNEDFMAGALSDATKNYWYESFKKENVDIYRNESNT